MGSSSSASSQEEEFHQFGDKIDQKFLQKSICRAEISIRPVLKMFDHSDSIFYCSDQKEVLIVSFHEEDDKNERVTYIRQEVRYVENLKYLQKYTSWKDTWTQDDQNPQIFISDILFLCEPIAKLPYKTIDNNCNASAEQLTHSLNLFYEILKRERQIKIRR